MNKWQQEAIEQAIGNMQDNLYRARLAKKGDPNWKSGNGETIDQVIAGYELQLARLEGKSEV